MTGMIGRSRSGLSARAPQNGQGPVLAGSNSSSFLLAELIYNLQIGGVEGTC